MRISEDGLILISATTYDLQYGTIIIPPSVMSIADSAFRDCTYREFTWFEAFWNYVFNVEYADNLSFREITIPEGVTHIGVDAFRGCSRLRELTISNNVTHIGRGAFAGCSSQQ